MELLTFHNYLKTQNVNFQNLTGDFKHCIYKNETNGKAVTIPKVEGKLHTITILIACKYLEVQLPTMVKN